MNRGVKSKSIASFSSSVRGLACDELFTMKPSGQLDKGRGIMQVVPPCTQRPSPFLRQFVKRRDIGSKRLLRKTISPEDMRDS